MSALLSPVFAALVVGTAIGAAAAAEPTDAKTTAEIHIGLPAGTPPAVTLSPGRERIVLELPRGADFPREFAESSGGMVRGQRVEELDGGRVRLVLDLAQGLLEQVRYEPDKIVLRFESRLDLIDEKASPEQRYLLGPDDKVVMTVHGHPDHSGPMTVTRDGLVTAPLVGDVQAAGLTPRQLSTKLTELLGRDYLRNPKVDLEVVEYRSQWVIVEGPVRKPGRIPLRGGTRLKEVLGEAGGFDDRNGAGEEIRISRQVEGGGAPVILQVERTAFESGARNPVLAHGDIIQVSLAKLVYIQGEVGDPGAVKVERDMTLTRAITHRGGLTQWADKKSVRVIYDSQGTPRERVFNIKRIMEGKAPDPGLQGGELIVVGRRFL